MSGTSAQHDSQTGERLPPGPHSPSVWQATGLVWRPRSYLTALQRRYGSVFRIRLPGYPQGIVFISDPAAIKQVFTADSTVLHAGDGSPLRGVLGHHSLFSIDEGHHLEQRRLLLPPFKGQRMAAYAEIIEEIAVAEIEQFPEGEPFGVADAMQRITLRAILRAVFGARGRDLTDLEALIPDWTIQASRLATRPGIRRDLGPRSPWGRFIRLRGRIDAILDGMIAVAKADPAVEERPDVLASLVRATHTDGTLMENEEIRDQLVTMLFAGHETTAHQLAWAVERLTRNPRALDQLVAEIDAGEEKTYRDATIREVMRQRPVIFFATRRVMEPYEVAGFNLPVGAVIAQAAVLTQLDPAIFPDPNRFSPERFLNEQPDTYAWIPYGGGVRRCIGASFAHLEMDIVLRVLLERVTLQPTTAPAERSLFRGIAQAPAEGGLAVLHRRGERAARGPSLAGSAA